MTANQPTLNGVHVRLEPLCQSHAGALVEAVGGESELYRWSPIPRDPASCADYLRVALAARDTGTAVPFATVCQRDGAVIGSTRFFNLEYWAWPPGHPRHGQTTPDACEIGYTWLAPSAIRSAANTEAKLLMLTHAFEIWKVFRVSFHTDIRNERSRAALARIGAKFEGVLRGHRLAADLIPRDSARFSILAQEWPAIKERLSLRA